MSTRKLNEFKKKLSVQKDGLIDEPFRCSKQSMTSDALHYGSESRSRPHAKRIQVKGYNIINESHKAQPNKTGFNKLTTGVVDGTRTFLQS